MQERNTHQARVTSRKIHGNNSSRVSFFVTGKYIGAQHDNPSTTAHISAASLVLTCSCTMSAASPCTRTPAVASGVAQTPPATDKDYVAANCLLTRLVNDAVNEVATCGEGCATTPNAGTKGIAATSLTDTNFLGRKVRLRFGGGFGMLNAVKALESRVIHMNEWTLLEHERGEFLAGSLTESGTMCTYWVQQRDIVGEHVSPADRALATLGCA